MGLEVVGRVLDLVAVLADVLLEPRKFLAVLLEDVVVVELADGELPPAVGADVPDLGFRVDVADLENTENTQ